MQASFVSLAGVAIIFDAPRFDFFQVLGNFIQGQRRADKFQATVIAAVRLQAAIRFHYVGTTVKGCITIHIVIVITPFYWTANGFSKTISH